jgi:hypothetical protein
LKRPNHAMLAYPGQARMAVVGRYGRLLPLGKEGHAPLASNGVLPNEQVTFRLYSFWSYPDLEWGNYTGPNASPAVTTHEVKLRLTGLAEESWIPKPQMLEAIRATCAARLRAWFSAKGAVSEVSMGISSHRVAGASGGDVVSTW